MTRTERNRRSSLPVSRNIIPAGASTSTGFNLNSPHADIRLAGQGIRKGKRAGHTKGGNSMWRTVSQNYKTAATIDKSWDSTVSAYVSGSVL